MTVSSDFFRRHVFRCHAGIRLSFRSDRLFDPGNRLMSEMIHTKANCPSMQIVGSLFTASFCIAAMSSATGTANFCLFGWPDTNNSRGRPSPDYSADYSPVFPRSHQTRDAILALT